MFGVLIRSMKEAVVESALSSFRVCRIIYITSHSKSISGCFYALASACFTMFLYEKKISQKIMQSNPIQIVSFSWKAWNRLLHLLKQHGFKVEEFSYWTGLPGVQTFHQPKTSRVSWHEKHNKQDPELLRSFIRHKWDNISLSKVHKLVFSVLTHLQECKSISIS